MKTPNNIINGAKKVYNQPVLKTICIDNEISLVLNSAPPINFDDPMDPGCTFNNIKSSDYFYGQLG